MKKGIKNILILLLSLTLFSCSDSFLDTKPLDKYSEADVWSDANIAQAFIYDIYGDIMVELVKNPLGINGAPGTRSDDYSDNIATRRNNVVKKDQLDRNFDAGWDVFHIIRKCNLAIEKVTESSEITEALKVELIAQAKMLRAMIYYSRARLFGKYIIIERVLTEEDDFKLPRSSTIKETYDFILSDLQDAAEGLPEVAPAGQLTRGAALAYLAEVALHGAAYIESGKSEYYQVSKKASEDLFALGYSLDSDYRGLTSDYGSAIGSSEVILGYFRHVDNTEFRLTPMQRIVPNCSEPKNFDWVVPKLSESFEGWAEVWPSQELVDDYLVVDQDGDAKKWDETSYYQDFLDNGGYVSDAIYKNRDARFYTSIVHDSSQFYGNLVTIRKGGNMHWESNASGNWSMTRTGYYFRKSVFEGQKLWARDNVPFHHLMARLGRSYLNYSEVMLRLNDPATALQYINMTRSAHGQLPELSTGLSLDDAWKYYRIERRVELFYENDRYWSLLRWGKEAGDIIIPELNKGLKAIEIATDGRSFELVDLPLDATTNEAVFSTRKYLFPVPEPQRLLNENLDQNPGW
ncbi:MAG: RagB/SusD family nutrient uptake outer membrane protein [Cyclobacteriaceae bacterium]